VRYVCAQTEKRRLAEHKLQQFLERERPPSLQLFTVFPNLFGVFFLVRQVYFYFHVVDHARFRPGKLESLNHKPECVEAKGKYSNDGGEIPEGLPRIEEVEFGELVGAPEVMDERPAEDVGMLLLEGDLSLVLDLVLLQYLFSLSFIEVAHRQKVLQAGVRGSQSLHQGYVLHAEDPGLPVRHASCEEAHARHVE